MVLGGNWKVLRVYWEGAEGNWGHWKALGGNWRLLGRLGRQREEMV